MKKVKTNKGKKEPEASSSKLREKTPSLRNIGYRYSILASGLLLVVVGLIGYLHTYRENNSLATQMENRARLLRRTVGEQYIDAAIKSDESTLRRLANELYRNERFESLSLYDADGRCIWHFYSRLKDRKLPNHQIDVLKQGTPFLLNRSLFQNRRVYEVIVPLARGPELYAFLKIDYPLREFSENLRTNYYLLGIVTAGFVIASILWAWLISNTILRPVDWLTQGVKEVARGDFSTHIPSSSPRELAILTENFNQMVSKLKSTRAELNRHQDSLEETIKRIRAELEETHRKLSHSEKLAAIGQLAAGVAHEINNPLTSIRMLSQLLLDELKEERPAQNLKEILNQSRRCQKIVKGLLTFARDRKAHYRTVDINSLLKSSLNSLSKQKTFKNIEVVNKLSVEPIFVEGDSEQLGEVFTNIMLNAEKAMEGKGMLTVESSLTDDMVKISIVDTGCGIPRENLNKIFDPFYTSSKREQGTGLGLSISYGIVHEHQGSIEVESQVGKGSVFTVCLPKGKESPNSQ